MSYPITQNLIPGLPKIPYRHGIGAYEGVVAHATAVYEDSDTGERDFEARDRHWQHAFVHFFVDYDSITQVQDINYEAYGAGSVANRRFVHVELCQTKDTGRFKESYSRYVWLLSYLLEQKRLGVTFRETLWGHDDIRIVFGDTTHTDPWDYLASHGVSKEQFIQDVKNSYEGKEDELTMGQYEELKKEIADLKQSITELVNNDVPADDYAKAPLEWAKDKDHRISTGERPQGLTKRQETVTMIKNYHDNYGCTCRKGN